MAHALFARHSSASHPVALARITHATALVVLLAAALSAQRSSTSDPLAHAKALLATTPFVDGHNDLPRAIRESKTAQGDVEAYDLRKLAGENVLRALSQAEQVAKRLQKEGPPSKRTIRDLDTPLEP